jgi:zinc/manganese transport system substrate-binding protein
MRMRIVLILAATAALATGCGGSAAANLPSVVASTNVYGDIAAQIGGSHVHVASIMSDPNADPHLFEPGTRAGLAVARARLVIRNGLGYDAFVDKLQAASPSATRVQVSIADALGAHGTDVNPHLWYDVPRLPLIAAAIAGGLERAVPARAAAFRAGLRRFDASLGPLDRVVAAIRRAHAGEPVAYTEPVPEYLIAAAGLRNLAPAAFTRALEDGSEPPPAAVAQMVELASGHRIRVLLYNDQAVSPISQRVRDAATAAGVPVVAVSETLPHGSSFQAWQFAQAQALQAALAR